MEHYWDLTCQASGLMEHGWLSTDIPSEIRCAPIGAHLISDGISVSIPVFVCMCVFCLYDMCIRVRAVC